MTNYENQKERIDAILNSNNSIAIDIDTNEITTCRSLACSRCLFCGDYNECYKNTIKWLFAEYKEPEVNWSKVPVDTPVLVSHDGKKWCHRHFSRVVNGIPYIWMYGSTSWTAHNNHNNEMTYRYIKLVEVDNEKSK